MRPPLGQHDVALLKVSIHHTLPVGIIQSIRNLDGVLQRLLQQQWPLREPCGQTLHLQVLHDQVVDAVLLSDVVEGANVGVIQAGPCPVSGGIT